MSESMRARLAEMPKVHPPGPYEVYLADRKTGKILHTRYVRASSTERARLAAVIHDRETFGIKNTVAGSAKLLMPVELLGRDS